MDAYSMQKKKAEDTYLASKNVGDVDCAIIPLVDAINQAANLYTTSSCSGRISLLDDSGVKGESFFRKKWHKPTSASQVLPQLLEKPVYTLWFKYEPPIVHVVAKDLPTADGFTKLCRQTGFKRAGIQSIKKNRILIEVIGTRKIEAPVATKEGLMVEENYIKWVVEKSCEYMAKDRENLANLKKNIVNTFLKRD